ncbi:MAG: preprotein translocase subunit YajC [Candidatus Hydrogenedentota bacterium]
MWIEWIHIVQEAPAGESGGGLGPFIQFLPIFLIGGIFWMLVISPQRKRDTERKNMLEALSKGDDVISSGGLCGTIVKLHEKSVIVKVSDDPMVKLEILRTSIGHVVPKEAKE